MKFKDVKNVIEGYLSEIQIITSRSNMKMSERIWIYLFFTKMRIENLVDKYIFHTYCCPEHGYECHGRCTIRICEQDQIFEERNE